MVLVGNKLAKVVIVKISFLETLGETFSRHLTSRLDDIVADVIERDPTRFLDAHHVPVGGTEQSFVAFDFDWTRFALALEDEICTACRAMGFEAPRWNDVAGCHDVSQN